MKVVRRVWLAGPVGDDGFDTGHISPATDEREREKRMCGLDADRGKGEGKLTFFLETGGAMEEELLAGAGETWAKRPKYDACRTQRTSSAYWRKAETICALPTIRLHTRHPHRQRC